MRHIKATHSQIKRENRQLLLRTIYAGFANSRADLANETGLAKPTVSDLVAELIAEGYLVERGLGQSTDEGGKRPRLLHFVPDARQVIGISINPEEVIGVLVNLNGEIIVEHRCPIHGRQGQEAITAVIEAVNGLLAQLTAPLLCIGVGVDGTVDIHAGTVRYAAHMGWQDVPLHLILRAQFGVPVYVANNTELAAMAMFAFGEAQGALSVATITVDTGIGVGFLLEGGLVHHGAVIDNVIVDGQPLEVALDWNAIAARCQPFFAEDASPHLPINRPTYLHIRAAAQNGHPEAQAIIDDLGKALGPVVAWVSALIRPQYVVITGPIADLGDLLVRAILRVAMTITSPESLSSVRLMLESAPNLPALGAAAQSIQEELGLVS